ncbi:MAG: alternative ribosome rescue aminoacyl-tRNA hydrolase ArfB [Pleurocapsa sp.]
MLKISEQVTIPSREIEISAVRSTGAGEQNVNKIASAIHLRFDINGSSLPYFYKRKLLQLKDSRISQEGIIIIKAQQFRSQLQNREDAVQRLKKLIKSVLIVKKRRIKTKVSKSAKKRRLDNKAKRSQLKASRRKVQYE